MFYQQLIKRRQDMVNKKIMGLIFLAVFVSVGLVGFFTTNANAANAWYVCSVTKAGQGGTSYIYIYLTDTAETPKFTNLSFTAKTGQENRQLAIALSAMANGSLVDVYVDYTLSTVGQRIINAIYLRGN
jgi:hypothetical protein